MKRKWLIIAALVLLTTVLAAAPCLADTVGGAAVKGSGVRLRTAANTADNSNIICEMPDQTFLLVEERINGWYKVVCNGVCGYVSASYADFTEVKDGEYLFSAATKGTEIRMRAGAGTGYDVVKTIAAAGTELKVLGVSGSWLKVQDNAGATGYIRSDLVRYSSDEVRNPISTASSTAQAIVDTAKKYKGYAYCWGGMSPSTGFDCSGFANYVCSQNGISLHRVAQDSYSNDGVFVSKENLQPGDLVYFGYGASCVTHMGIYVGDGQMIHASTTYTGVIYSDINSSYYTRMYVGAKRVA